MLRNFFLPHPDTHKKAHLLSWKALIFYILLFVLLENGIAALNYVKPGVLGISSSITQQELIDLTNKEREKVGLPSLVEDARLDEAAAAKAKNMFEEDYWAHYSPSGKDPWGFIMSSGYKFSYAGENLARNFYTSPDVVSAWMASPTHKENIVNTKYKNIGIAIAEGELKGEKTILVVQEFGTPVESLADQVVPPTLDNKQSFSMNERSSSMNEDKSSSSNKKLAFVPNSDSNVLATPNIGNSAFLLDKYFMIKMVGMLIIAFISGLLVADIFVLHKRKVFQISPNHLSHLALLSLASGSLLKMSPGSIL